MKSKRKRRALLIDLDGVVYLGEQPIPGAIETLSCLTAEGIPHVFVTNTTSRPVSALASKLKRWAIDAPVERIMTPPVAAREWLRRKSIDEVSLCVPEPTREDFTGIVVTDIERSRAIVLGDLGEMWSGEILNRIFRRLMTEPPPLFLTLGTTRYWLSEDGLRLDVGTYAKALEFASGVTPLVFGKPSEMFFRAALDKLGCAAEDAMMVGDDVESDIHGAQAIGIAGVLVKTGKFLPRDLDAQPSPDVVLESIAELPRLF
jgi:HAD superfamily hydrolase (TIGR01458 family)